MKGCGSCTLCCTLMRVEMEPRPEPPKVAGVACGHLCRRGYGVYDDRPQSCRDFECLWLSSQSRFDYSMPKYLRPDKTGVVLEVNSRENVVAHCNRPDSWDRGPMAGFLRELATRTSVIIDHGDERVSLIEPTGQVSALRYVGTDIPSNERKYVREAAINGGQP